MQMEEEAWNRSVRWMAWTQVPFRGPVQLRRFLEGMLEEEAWQAVGSPGERARWQDWAAEMARETLSSGAV